MDSLTPESAAAFDGLLTAGPMADAAPKGSPQATQWHERHPTLKA